MNGLVGKTKKLALAITAAAMAAALALGGCSSGSASGSASSAASTAGSSQAASASAVAGSYEEALQKTLDYARSCAVAEGEGYEWLALSLARSGADVSAAPLADFKVAMTSHIKDLNGVMDENSSTAYSKAILAMTAVGADAADIDGINLLDGLSDMDFVEMQGINGPIWALIAVNSNPAYSIPENAEAERPASKDELVKAVLDAQGDDGGWPFMGNPEDEGAVDLTAMALTALAPLADGEDYEGVPEAIDRAVAFLSKAQLETGGFDGGGGESSESAAQVAIALSSLGIDPGTDERFVKDASVLDNLISFQDESGMFAHVAGEPANDVATDQACEALVAVQRLRAGDTPLYSM